MNLRSISDKARQDVGDALKAATPLPLRRSLVRSRLWLRGTTAQRRMLPDFVVLGGQRCGTSSLYKYLGRHPEIAPSLRKEVEYFTINHHLGEAWYRAHFPLTARRHLASALGHRLRTFEATPDYLFDPRAPARAAALLPDARYVVLLRDPSERAFSHYHHNVRLGLEDETFPSAIDLEDRRIGPDLDAMRVDPDHPALAFRRYSYVTRGHYARQLERWFAAVPRDRILVLESERFFADPAPTFLRVLDFVGLTPWTPPEFRNYSYGQGEDVDYPDLPPELRTRLDAIFADGNARLRELLGTPFWLA